MATVPNASVVFFPWVRQGAAAAIDTPDTLGANMRGAVDLTATLTINSSQSVPVPVRLRGPADVVGIDPHEVVRVDPKPNTTDFEPNYFPAIEFDRPDFPWLFTPAKAAAGAKLRPWLCLIVVRKQEGVIVASSADAPLAVLSINSPAKPVDELPDLGESWAWAHAQLAASSLASPQVLSDDLRTRPERSLSRLLCPRVLQPNTDYIACVVPTFDLGRRAGLGEEIKDSELTAANALKPAWSITPPQPTVTLPVYYQWQFRTGEVGDFESLVRLLRALPAPEGLGKRPMDISRPGFKLPATFPRDAQLALEGALRPIERKQFAPWPDGAQESFQTELSKIVNAPGEAQILNPDSDPLLAPPLYGQWHAARSTVTRGAVPWLDELNLDPRHRSVAAFGTRVVQEHQEALMASAWEQAGDLERANQRMRQLQLSLATSTSLYTRHFSQMSDEAVLRMSAPILARVRSGSINALETRSLAAKLNSTTLPLQAASTAMRRIARDRGPITRRVAAQGMVRSATANWLVALNSTASIGFVTPTLPDLAAFGVVRERVAQPNALSHFREVAADAVAGMRGRPLFRVNAEGQPVFASGVANLPPSADSGTAHHFRLAAQAHLSRVNPGRMGLIFAPPPPLAMRQARDTLMAQIEPKLTLVSLAQAIVGTAANLTMAITAPTNAGTVPIEPIMAAPKFPQPMYESLRDLSQQLLLPGLETVEPNSVLGLETNSRFVEAYMVGLNFEMGRELLWRGYPTDQRGTYFDRFWDSRAAGGDPDVFPLHGWKERPLGDPRTAPSGDRFVMLLRSALLRRYPSAVIYAAKAITINRRVRKPSGKPEDEKHPAFRGSLQPDVTFFGFDLSVDEVIGGHPGAEHGYFIVIQEQPTEPRFGVDVGTPTGEGTHIKVSNGPPPGTPLSGRTWGQNGAHMAGILRQQPVRIAIHASQFLKRS
jgi:hypothetical protein